MAKDTNRYGRGCDNDEHNRIQHEIFCGVVSRQKEKFCKQNDQYHECDLQNRHIYVPLHRPVPEYLWSVRDLSKVMLEVFGFLVTIF